MPLKRKPGKVLPLQSGHAVEAISLCLYDPILTCASASPAAPADLQEIPRSAASLPLRWYTPAYLNEVHALLHILTTTTSLQLLVVQETVRGSSIPLYTLGLPQDTLPRLCFSRRPVYPDLEFSSTCSRGPLLIIGSGPCNPG